MRHCEGVVALIALLHGRYRISNREVVALLQMVCRAHIVRNLRGRAEARGPWQEEAAALKCWTSKRQKALLCAISA